MRDIRFRGRDYNGVWRYGYLIYINGGLGIQEVTEYGPRHDEPCGGIHVESYSVDPETVGECCGLKDKNGKDVFGGDIVSYVWVDNPPTPLEVKWDSEMSRFGLSEIGEDSIYGFNQKDMTERGEVIGNIYESPELLEPPRDTVEA